MNKTEITLVTSCILYNDLNKDLYEYFEEVVPLFSFLVRRTIHHLRHELNGELETTYRARMKKEHNLTNRFVKVVIATAKKLLRLSLAAGEYLHSTYAKKIKNLNAKIIKTKAALNNSKIEKSRIKNLKTKLFWLEMRKNKLIQLKNNGSRPMLTFGTKRLLKSDLSNFLENSTPNFVPLITY